MSKKFRQWIVVGWVLTDLVKTRQPPTGQAGGGEVFKKEATWYEKQKQIETFRK